MLKDAKHFGRLWRVRNGAYNRLGFNPTQRPEETEEDAQQAGMHMREHVRQLVAPLPDLPDRYNPEQARPPSRRRHAASLSAEPTRAKYSRIQSSSISEDELEAFQEPERDTSLTDRFFKGGRARLDSAEEDLPPNGNKRWVIRGEVTLVLYRKI